MTHLALADLEACFEGVIPSIIATCASDGTPNISYLSHVALVDVAHVALSNQFFSKTARNIRENPRAALLLVDARDGAQYQLDIRFVESREAGAVFDELGAQLRASSAQIGMSEVMKLRAVDIYHVDDVRRLPLPEPRETPVVAEGRNHLSLAMQLARKLAEARDIDSLVDTALHELAESFRYEQVMLLVADGAHGRLMAVASRGYESSGVGAELPAEEGLASLALREKRLLKASDLSRVRRFAAAIRDSEGTDPRREIPLPRLAGAMSQVAVPLITGGRAIGVLFSESRNRYAYTRRDEEALTLVAGQLAAAMQLIEQRNADAPASPVSRPQAQRGAPCRLVHHATDDSVFLDDEYVIKGVSGRLLLYLVERLLTDGRAEFTNRELRLAPELGLPDFKDNLETRLLLLRRRLAERALPLQVDRVARGRIALRTERRVIVERVS